MARQWVLVIVGFILTAVGITVSNMAPLGYTLLWLWVATIGQVFLTAGLAAWAVNFSGVHQELRQIKKEMELHRRTELTDDLRNETSTHIKPTQS
jgi:hypothetical protein